VVAARAWLVVGLVNLAVLVFGDVGLWPLAAVPTFGTLGIAVWQELHRRGAARLLEANRKRWG
jgi:hypothetical protein